MINYTATDKGHYEEITLTDDGDTNGLDAVHIMYGDTIGAVILESEARGSRDWDEDAFRASVKDFIENTFEDQPDSLIFDPGRDDQTSEEM